jgi:hypothetical protein
VHLDREDAVERLLQHGVFDGAPRNAVHVQRWVVVGNARNAPVGVAMTGVAVVGACSMSVTPSPSKWGLRGFRLYRLPRKRWFSSKSEMPWPATPRGA